MCKRTTPPAPLAGCFFFPPSVPQARDDLRRHGSHTDGELAGSGSGRGSRDYPYGYRVPSRDGARRCSATSSGIGSRVQAKGHRGRPSRDDGTSSGVSLQSAGCRARRTSRGIIRLVAGMRGPDSSGSGFGGSHDSAAGELHPADHCRDRGAELLGKCDSLGTTISDCGRKAHRCCGETLRARYGDVHHHGTGRPTRPIASWQP